MAFVVSLVTAALSVFYACLRQQKISTLLSADDLKDWLSRPGIPSVQAGINRTVYIYIRLKQAASEPESAHDVAERDSQLWDLRNRIKAFISGKPLGNCVFQRCHHDQDTSSSVEPLYGAFLV